MGRTRTLTRIKKKGYPEVSSTHGNKRHQHPLNTLVQSYLEVLLSESNKIWFIEPENIGKHQ